MRHDPNLYGYDVFYVFTYKYVYKMYKKNNNLANHFIYFAMLYLFQFIFISWSLQTTVLVPDQLKIRFKALITFQGLLLCFGQHREGPPGLQVDQDPAVLLRD